MSDKNHSAYGDAVWAVLWFFFLLWAQSGWYRIDCALGQTAACNLIAAEYAARAKP